MLLLLAVVFQKTTKKSKSTRQKKATTRTTTLSKQLMVMREGFTIISNLNTIQPSSYIQPPSLSFVYTYLVTGITLIGNIRIF